MTFRVEVYKGQELVSVKTPGGWRVSIGNTGKKTGLHQEVASAFTEARRYLDKLTEKR